MDLVEVLGAETLVGITVILVLTLVMHVRWSRRVASLGPTVLTTLGIFFCFLGIALGLLNFDGEDVKNSVPELLDGIRTAFWASVAGIAGALTMKTRLMLAGEPDLPEGNIEGATVDDVVMQLQMLQKSIAGEEDSALVSQTKLLRLDSNERLDRLQSSFARFAETMAEANSKALINALSEVIRDFNTKLNEQFGENFKQLNEGVGGLLEWQRQYRESLDALVLQETNTRVNMGEAANHFSALVGKTDTFLQTTSALAVLLERLDIQRQSLDSSLRSLADLVLKASTGIPQIESKILEMTEHLGRAVKTSNDSIAEVLRQASNQMTENSTAMKEAVTKTMEKANSDLNSHVRGIAESTRKQVAELDRALESELTSSLESLGRQLTALSAKFVEDYTPLTDRLTKLVRLAEERR